MMKTLKTICCILLVCTSTFASAKKPQGVSVLSVKRDIFYFKVSAGFVGAHVDVYSSNGELIASGEISHRKSIVDFFFGNADSYTIKITKDNQVLNFTYKKSTPSPISEDDSMHHISITQ